MAPAWLLLFYTNLQLTLFTAFHFWIAFPGVPVPSAPPPPPPPIVQPAPPPVTQPPADNPPHPGDIKWMGQWWIRKTCYCGPGPSNFTSNNVSIQADGLHLKLPSEVISETQYGYGTYTWHVTSPTYFAPNIASGFFTWNDDPAYTHREIDFEGARWNQPNDPTNAQFVVQPYTIPANIKRLTIDNSPATISFTWRADKVVFHYNDQTWTYTGASIPRPSAGVHINLWNFSPGGQAEMIVKDFSFAP